MKKMWSVLMVVAVATGAAACTEEGLGPASIANAQDTVVLGSLYGSALSIPSGFSAAEGAAVQTDRLASFDLVYQLLPGGRHALLPLAAIGLKITNGTNPGLQKSTLAFASIKAAPSGGYNTTDSLTINPDDVVLVRSRVVCASLGVPQYAKLRILSFDDAAETVRFEFIANLSCGYRNLEPGIPEN